MMTNFEKRVAAIKELYPNVTANIDNEAFDNDGNQVIVDETNIANKITEMDAARAAAATQKATDQANGNQKLLDLGLTQAEATALTGYTPPSE
jgi:hypothetical protein